MKNIGWCRQFGWANKPVSGKPEDHKLLFAIKVHDDLATQGWNPLTLETVPQDEDYPGITPAPRP